MSFRNFPAKNTMKNNLDLNEIRIFVAVAKSGSFVLGGKTLGLTRSAAGKAVARLETQLGTRLLHRTTRSVTITSDGQSFYERCVQILHDLDEAQANLRQDYSQPRGTLRLTVSEAYGRVMLLPFIKLVSREWPELDMELNFTDRLVDLIDEGFDLGIRVGGLPKDSELVARVIMRTRPHLYAAPSYIEANGKPENLSALSTHRRLVYGLGSKSTAWSLIGPDGAALSVDGETRLRFDSGAAIHEAALKGIGIAYLPSFIIKDDIREKRLITLLSEYGGNELPIYAIYPSRKHLAAKVRVFIDRLIVYLESTEQAPLF